MARRVGGGTRRATFEVQSEFFRKEATDVEKKETPGPTFGQPTVKI
jgi:hypothetical protein